MFIAEPLAELNAETVGTFVMQYTPATPHDAELRIVAPSDAIRVTRVEAALLDGTVLAASFRQKQRDREAVTTVAFGHLEVPVRVSVAVRAVVPVSVTEATLQILADSYRASVTIPLAGHAKFVPARSTIRVSPGDLRPGITADVDVVLINDGTAVAAGAELHLRPPVWTNVEADGARRELHADEGPLLVLPLPDLQVGASSSHRFRATLAPVIAHGTPISFEAVVVHGERRFNLTPVVVNVTSEARLRASVQLTEQRAFRYGERIAAIVALRAMGSDVIRNVRVSIASSAIAWDGVPHDTPLTLEFGDVPPLTDTAHLIEGTIISTPSDRSEAPIMLSADTATGLVEASGCTVAIVGAPEIVATLAVRELPDESAYEVVCAIRNDGDGEATSVVVHAHPRDYIVGVVDSLVIDGRSRLSLDGSLAVDHDGIDVGPLSILSAREVRWKVRSSVEHDVALGVELLIDGMPMLLASPSVWFSAGHRAEDIVAQRAAAVPAWVGVEPARDQPSLEPSPAAPPPMPSLDAQIIDDRPASVAEEDAAPVAAAFVQFEVGATTISRWKAWFGEDGPTSDVELGRYILAAREFLPVAASGAEQGTTLTAIRGECNAVATARLLSWKSTDTIGASGYDFATPTLRASVGTFWNLLGQPQSALEGVQLDAAIVALTAAHGTPFAAEVDAFRDRLLEILERTDSTERYADVAVDLQPAASRLFSAMCDMEVAA